jgi:regulator of sigma E protease
MDILNFFIILLEVVLLFNLLIIVHEFGHFLAARWRGLKVERFGVWFGKPIWQRKINGVTYCLGSIPAGGYVALPQMAPMEAIEGKNEEQQESLPPVSPLDKIIVAFAGPLFSFGLALAFAFLVWGIGRPMSEADSTTVIGHVFQDSPAEKAGLKPGDKILEVDGEPVSKFTGIGDSVTWRVVRSEGETIPVRVERDGRILTVEAKPVKEETDAWERSGLRQIKIAPKQTPIIAKIYTNSPAAEAGLKPNDVILEVDGQRLYSTITLGEYIGKKGEQQIDLTVRRGEKVFEVALTPERPINLPDDERPMIGIGWDFFGQAGLVHPGPVEQIRSSVNAMASTIGALFSPKSDIKPQHLAGPVGIMRIYYMLFESEQGWRHAIWFSVLLNVNLALLNLLPIPVLDGGHIVMALVEWVRRKPISILLLQRIQTACAVVLIGFMLYLTVFDSAELFNGNGNDNNRNMQPQFAPKEPAQTTDSQP